MHVAIVGGREVGLSPQADEYGAGPIDRGIVVNLAQHRAIEVPVLPRLFPVEPVDPGFLEHGVAKERAPRLVGASGPWDGLAAACRGASAGPNARSAVARGRTP